MTWRITTRSTCRLCGAAGSRRFLHLMNVPLTDEFVSAEQRGQEFVADLDVYFCPACRTVQTLHDVEAGEYYRDYGYTVSASGLARRFMERLTEETARRFGTRPGDRVLEIGSGDGAQLSCFQKLGAQVLGVEPSGTLTKAARESGIETVQGLFDAEAIGRIPVQMRPAQVVLLTYTFDHLPEPRLLLEAVGAVLDPQRGVLLIEVHDLERIIERRETCLFEHEHTVYLHRRSMKRLLENAGLKLLTTELVPTDQRRGNSLLIAAALTSADHAPDGSADVSGLEHLDTWEHYAEFATAVELTHARLREHVRSQVARGRRVAGYGAGGRGVMTLAMAGLTAADIAYLCDQNQGFHGLYTPATHVPVKPPEHLLEDPVNEVIVFSYGYLDEIRAAWRAYEERGGRFVSLLELLR